MFFKNLEAEAKIKKWCKDLYEVSAENLFNHNGVYLFGGAVRDALAGEENCNDFDIIMKNKNSLNINSIPGSVDLTNHEAYPGHSLFHVTSLKVQSGNKIDLMYPDLNVVDFKNITEMMMIFYIVANVDFKANGILWHPSFGFLELVSDAMEHCKRKLFVLNNDQFITDERKEERIKKFKTKGWLVI